MSDDKVETPLIEITAVNNSVKTQSRFATDAFILVETFSSHIPEMDGIILSLLNRIQRQVDSRPEQPIDSNKQPGLRW